MPKALVGVPTPAIIADMADWLINGSTDAVGRGRVSLSVMSNGGLREIGIAEEHALALLALVEPYLWRLEDESKYPTEVARVRAWARDAGYAVSPRGRLPSLLLAAYRDATGHFVVDRSGRRRATTTIDDVSSLRKTDAALAVTITCEVVVVSVDGSHVPFAADLLDQPTDDR